MSYLHTFWGDVYTHAVKYAPRRGERDPLMSDGWNIISIITDKWFKWNFMVVCSLLPSFGFEGSKFDGRCAR